MSEVDRPNADEILARMKREETAAGRGKLKIFFGMSPGVGKTYAMLQAARQKQAEGCEVVVGIVETHGRKETEALLEGMPIMPRTQIEYRGTTLSEMDLDAILTWHPGLAVVDELAHTNAPGSRHPKRYQDVLELLDAGISVYTTLNVQHVASRSDTVRQISGVSVHETVPDSVLDLADEIMLVDLTPEQLRVRRDTLFLRRGERGVGGEKFLSREQPDRLARNGVAAGGRTCRSRSARHHVRGKNRRAVEEWRSLARRGQRESLLGEIDSLHAPVGGIDGSFLDRREHRATASAFARRANTLDSLSRAGAPAGCGSNFHARYRYRRSAAPYRPSTQRHPNCHRQAARRAMDKFLETRSLALAHAPQRQHRYPHDSVR